MTTAWDAAVAVADWLRAKLSQESQVAVSPSIEARDLSTQRTMFVVPGGTQHELVARGRVEKIFAVSAGFMRRVSSDVEIGQEWHYLEELAEQFQLFDHQNFYRVGDMETNVEGEAIADRRIFVGYLTMALREK